jgi:hypothetical protein
LNGVFSWLRRKVKVNNVERTRVRVSNVANIRVTMVNPWHAVGVSCGKTACRASMAERHVRYLSQEAPPLPLAGCTHPKECLCKYKHFNDRRAGPRRTTDSELYKNALSPHVLPKLTIQERRTSRGRRANDAG